MKSTVTLTFVVVLGLIVGCSSNNPGKNVASNAPVLDVAPIPAAEPTPSPAAPPAEAQAVAFAAPTAPVAQPLVTPALDTAPAPAAVAATPAASGKKYTVKKGDTLFSIAKTQLGSGKDWQKIAAANPGLTPQKLKAGQKIVMP